MTVSDRVLVTGCAGFIGSQLAERLIDRGHEVVGLDCFTPFYDRGLKEANLARLREESSFTLCEVDLSRDPLEGVCEGIDVVMHLAAQPGVRQSFGIGSVTAERHNTIASARLMREAAGKSLRSFVYASSSTVYGDAASFPTPEDVELRPISPYGSTKVKVEMLAAQHQEQDGLPAIGLRFFSGYGPRQRPDMAFSRFIGQAIRHEPLTVKGSGRQRRDFTFVGDFIDAMLRAGAGGRPGSVYNVGGGTPVTLSEAISLLGAILEIPIAVEHHPVAPGDAKETCADGRRMRDDFGFVPTTPLAEGLAAQVEWALAGERSLLAA